ncbi:helix-turn-helix transcriptional regulator [Actinomadura madurae]|uniref:helix-turn-helix transcriptional regulator n=1 Tax=Actinomadura madurae TaxID=1993 RepID=UPI0020D23AC2|nr:helix-turn-helix transcriptional regulator [Actinomadura madurae]MCQ0020462.1 helix-turn-helix transcriptional regulator [Actinomadura madurae]
MGNASPTVDIGVLRRMRIARDAMDREWAGPLDIAAVAARAGYSRYHFVRLFSEVYGETPGAYLARRRIERAQDLLRTANLTVTEICVLVGFSSLGTFCTRFKQQTGMTPTEFRRTAGRPGASSIPGCFVLLWAGGFRRD